MSDTGRVPFRLADFVLPLVVIGTATAAAVLSVVVWLSSVAAAVDVIVPTPIWPLMRALAIATSEDSLNPLIGAQGSRIIFWTVTVALAVLLGGLLVVLTVWVHTRRDPLGRSLAHPRDYDDMRGTGARRRAASLRPALRGRDDVDRREVGLRLGRLGRHDIIASFEDVVLHIGGPRGNKTSASVVGAILTSPGPVIATSNKVDIHILTSALRAEVGQVFIFDPQHIAGVEQSWWWNPLSHIRDIADAHQLIVHFTQTIGSGNERADPYFTKGAERLLAQLVLAAALSKRSLRDVREWLATRSEIPVQLLRDAGQNHVATGLLGTIEAPPDQRGGLYETALTAIACLESEAVARYVTPPSTWLTRPLTKITQFDPWQFLVGYDTDWQGRPSPHDSLYLFTREGAGTGAPVVAALVDYVLKVAAQAATAQGGRVEPPLRAVLDEAANICPIQNLPDLYSYFGSMSIQVLTYLQSYQQGVHIWGQAGMHKLWGAATVKMIGAGVHDPNFCADLSRLVGEHDVATYNHQYGQHGHTSVSSRRDSILSAADIARLPKTKAVLLVTGRKAGMIRLLPWYTEKDAAAITAHAVEATRQVRTAARNALGPDNPLAKVLAEQP